MQVTGIIAEYNPFHNGHEYQLNTLREQTHADYIVIAMSGNFLQRGVPAIIDKYARAQMALSCGADLVLELPSLWASASAEYFATAGVTLLAKTGVVNTLGYGVECEKEELPLLKELAHLLLEEPDVYRKRLLSAQKEGLSFPAARAAGLASLTSDVPAQKLDSLLSTPNNILALEYEKALLCHHKTNDCQITSFPIKRIGGGYHDKQLHDSFSSAAAIRRLLHTEPEDSVPVSVTDSMPKKAHQILEDYQKEYSFINEDSISAALGYRLWELCRIDVSHMDCSSYADCSPDLSNRIQNRIEEYQSFTQFCSLLKTRELTYTRISRALLHILLHHSKEDYALGKELDYIPYLRVLGFHKSAKPLLTAIKKEASIPLITKPADASSLLSKEAYSILKKDLEASELYRQLIATTSKNVPKSDCRRELILL